MEQHTTTPTIETQRCPRCQATLIFRTLAIDGKNVLYTKCCGTDITELIQEWGYPSIFV